MRSFMTLLKQLVIAITIALGAVVPFKWLMDVTL